MPRPGESMREIVGSAANGYEIYHARQEQYDTGEAVPFEVSPQPLRLSTAEVREIDTIGEAVTAFHHAANELYRTNEDVREILDRGKPEIFLDNADQAQYLFVRPDLIITDEGFSICEIETSPFGLALADILNQSYRQAGFETLVSAQTLQHAVDSATPSTGTIIYSAKTASYEGQLTYLADRIFTRNAGNWNVSHVDGTIDTQTIYRGFYASEYDHDSSVERLVESIQANQTNVIPSLTPALEEKAIMGLLWDKRWEGYFTRTLGAPTFAYLRKIIPPTIIVGEEHHFAPGLPHGIADIAGLAGLSKSQRTFVLKPSMSSWAEGLHFLHKKSGTQARELLHHAVHSSRLQIVQEFRPGRKIPLSIEREDENAYMQAKVRLTPYFEVSEGKLVAIKATGCENTDRIHGSSSSINTAVAQE